MIIIVTFQACISKHELSILFFLLHRQYITNYSIVSKVLCELRQLVLLSCHSAYFPNTTSYSWCNVSEQTANSIVLLTHWTLPMKQALKRGGDWAHCPIPLLEHEPLHRLPNTSFLLGMLLICDFYQGSASASSHHGATSVLFCFHLFNCSISFRNYSF